MVGEHLQELPLPCPRPHSFELFYVMSLFAYLSTTFIHVPTTFPTNSEQTQGFLEKARDGPARVRDEPPVHRGNGGTGTRRRRSPRAVVFPLFSRLSSPISLFPILFYMYSSWWECTLLDEMVMLR